MSNLIRTENHLEIVNEHSMMCCMAMRSLIGVGGLPM